MVGQGGTKGKADGAKPPHRPRTDKVKLAPEAAAKVKAEEEEAAKEAEAEKARLAADIVKSPDKGYIYEADDKSDGPEWF